MTQRRKMAQTVLAIAVIATLFMTSCTWSGGTTPETLPQNRYPLSFTGAVSGVYDGSAALTIDIPDIIERTDVTVPAYVNLLPMSVDGSDMPLDGVGYRQECALGGNGAERSAAGVGVSGFIPVKKGDVIRVADPEKKDFDTALVFALYGKEENAPGNVGKTVADIRDGSAYGTLEVSGNTVTWDTSDIAYYFWNDFAFLRVTTHSADAIVTVNEEITEVNVTQRSLASDIKVGSSNLDIDIAKPVLSGKTVVFFGDSIFGMTRDSTSVAAYTAEFTGADVYNIGFGGCRMSTHPTEGYSAFSMYAIADAISSGSYSRQEQEAAKGEKYFADQLEKLRGIDFDNVDMIVIHYGTNDFAGGVPLDDPTDDDSRATVCGALRYTVRKILERYPKIRIFISVPIYRMWNATGAEKYTNKNGTTLPEYVSAMRKVANEFNLPVIDGYGGMGINSINSHAYLYDGTHLNAYGRRVFGEYIGGALISQR